jgi:hypothetical protein
MKNIVLLILMSLVIQLSYAEKTRFFIYWSSTVTEPRHRDKLDLFCISLEGEIVKKMEQYLPCASYNDLANVAALLQNEREKQLLGVGDDEALKSIAGGLGSQYLITIKIMEVGSEVAMFVKCLDTKKAQAMVMLMEQAPNNEGAFDVMIKLADKFVEQICRYEICPYKGLIKVEVTEDLKVDVTKEYPIYCNDQDRIYKMHYKETKHTENFWAFEKVTRVSARAYLDFNISEESEKEIEDGCFACPSGKTRRYYHETNSKTGKIDEVSSESELYGMRINDARINITFNDDGTYIIKIEAASDVGEVTETRYQNEECWCAKDYGPPKTLKHKTDIPLTYIFGPYKGSAKDKFLTQKPDPVEETNAISGSKTTYNISFDLERE